MIGFWETIFWLFLLIIGYTYFGYPVLLIAVSCFIHRPVRVVEDHRPSVSLLVPAHNEEWIIEEKIRNCLALDYPEGRLEIAVASDGSTDGTVELVERYRDRGVRLFACDKWRGKVRMLNETIPSLRGEVIVLTDASVMCERDALLHLVRNFGDPDVGGVWGDKVYRNPGRLVSGEGESLYLRYEKFTKLRESRMGSIVSAEGSLFALRASLFRPVLDPEVMDDYYLSAFIRDQGFRLVYEPRARSHENVASSSDEEYRRKVRIVQGGLRGFWIFRHLANPFRTGFYAVQILSRQFLRRAVAVLFPPLALTNAFLLLARPTPVYRITMAVQIIVLLLALAGFLVGKERRWRRGGWVLSAVFIPYYVVMVNVAVLHGLWNLARGKTVKRWCPPPRRVDSCPGPPGGSN